MIEYTDGWSEDLEHYIRGMHVKLIVVSPRLEDRLRSALNPATFAIVADTLAAEAFEVSAVHNMPTPAMVCEEAIDERAELAAVVWRQLAHAFAAKILEVLQTGRPEGLEGDTDG